MNLLYVTNLLYKNMNLLYELCVYLYVLNHFYYLLKVQYHSSVSICVVFAATVVDLLVSEQPSRCHYGSRQA
jgi:hypothetical protein